MHKNCTSFVKFLLKYLIDFDAIVDKIVYLHFWIVSLFLKIIYYLSLAIYYLNFGDFPLT